MTKLGIFLRNMGTQSSRETLTACAELADGSGVDDLWLADHVAIPPDQSQGSNGRYLDPLATAAYLAAATKRIHFGTGVLVLPYRPALPTAKWVATIQELSGGRFLFGVGSGWMEPEFRALGVPRERRGRLTEETLDLVNRAFAGDEVVENGQSFLFRPRPPRPPIIVGGGAEVAIPRAARHGDGWFPMGADAENLSSGVDALRRAFDAAGKPSPEVVVLTSLAIDDAKQAVARARELAGLGATRIVHGERYADEKRFAAIVRTLDDVRSALAGV
jgi:probable F420-dependent oxidoreductase